MFQKILIALVVLFASSNVFAQGRQKHILLIAEKCDNGTASLPGQPCPEEPFSGFFLGLGTGFVISGHKTEVGTADPTTALLLNLDVGWVHEHLAVGLTLSAGEGISWDDSGNASMRSKLMASFGTYLAGHWALAGVDVLAGGACRIVHDQSDYLLQDLTSYQTHDALSLVAGPMLTARYELGSVPFTLSSIGLIGPDLSGGTLIQVMLNLGTTFGGATGRPVYVVPDRDPLEIQGGPDREITTTGRKAISI